MRIGIDARYVYPGHVHGIGRYSAELVRHLAAIAEGHELVVFRRPDLGAPITAGLEDAVPPGRVREIPVREAPVSPGTVTSFGRVVRAEGLDLYHALFPVVPADPAPRLVVTAHDLQALRVRGFHGGRLPPVAVAARLFYRWAYASAFRRADRIVAGSTWTRDDVERTFGVPRERFRVVPEGLGAEFREEPPAVAEIDRVRARLGLDAPYLLTVGNTRPQKNVPALLEGFAVYRRRADAELPGGPRVLVLAGVRDRFTPAAEALAGRLGLGGAVRFPGAIREEDLRPLYAGASLYLTASEHEGFGFTPLEAMACGAPVAAAARGALPEVLGDAYRPFDPASPTDLACAIIEVLSDPERAAALRDRGRARARGYTWDQAARLTLEAYEDVR